MKPEIKQRIEQLNNGKIPKGYQKTDFGVFPSDWVTDKKLIDIGNFGKGKGIPGNKMQSGGVPCVGYGDIYMKYNHFHFEEAQSFVDEETAKDSPLIKKGTLLFTGTGETAEEIGKCVCYNGYSTICAGGDIITFVPQDVNPLFLAYQQYQNFSLKKKASFGQGHSVVHIQKESLEKLNVAYPESKNEQSRIVEILMKWDKAIELYDKQIDALTRYKAVCLRKTFPAKGQNVPEWRFQGFSDAWTHCKLSDEFSDFIVPMRDKPKDFGGCIPWTRIEDIEGKYLNGTLSDQYVSEETIKKMNLKIIPKNSLIVSSSATFGVVAIVTSNLIINQTFIGLVPYEKDTIDFWYSFFQSDEPRKYMKLQSSGSTIFYIAREHFEKMPIKVPRKEERIKIGKFFSNLDDLITLHQRKKEVIINQRKTLQQYLLNGIVRVR